MAIFYASCPAGLESVAARMAGKNVVGFELMRSLSGALIFNAKARRPGCAAFQNVYLLIARYDNVQDMRRAVSMASVDRKRLATVADTMERYGFQSFRVMFSDANRLCAVEPSDRVRMEKAIGMRIDRVNPDTELLLLRRTEGFALLLLRLTNHEAKKPERGELSGCVASCMTYLARPTPRGVFLDPFAGHGALGIARRAMGAFARIHLTDRDVKSIPRGQGFAVETLDALELDKRFSRGEISEIATDPPWGLFEKLPMPAEAFYERLLSQFGYVLSPGGTFVLLTADKERFAHALSLHGREFESAGRHELLIHGKKAALFVARRLEDERNDQSPKTTVDPSNEVFSES